MDSQFDHLADILVSIKSKGEMKVFLMGLLTSKELADIPKRLEIVRLLKKGIPQQEIARRLHVGVATVTRGSKELGKGRFQNITASWQPSGKGG